MNLVLPKLAVRAASDVAWRSVALQGWGRLGSAPCQAARPERLREVAGALMDASGRNIIAHGGGRSYGDAALNGGGAVVLTGRLDRMLGFDATTGVLVAEPGVTFADVIKVFLPQGFLPPTPPGTAFATLGGAVANDVHGKNQHVAGCFGDHVEWLELMVADGSTRRLSPTQDARAFQATIGGIGLTGVITALALRLLRVPSNAMRVRRQRIGGLDEYLDAFRAARGASWSVGWIDALAGGAALGRGILETAEHAAESVAVAAPGMRRMPFDAPGLLLNPLSVRAFNAAYWRRVPAQGDEQVMHANRFLFPLDGIGAWNRLYGSRGFHQFQCVLPEAEAPRGLRLLLEEVGRSGAASFLAVLKWMGREGSGMLSFAQPGFTLALDIPARPTSRALLLRLERITRDHGGRIYLAKDSALSPQGMAEMYPRLAAFQEVRARLDPQGRFASDMSRRLGLG
jgi:decaprenylphospho-beta-D-ribofuranose 2-oxidase